MEETGTQRKMTKDDYRGMYAFECSCGARMACNGQQLDRAIFGAKYFKCPNHLYGTCNKSYSAQHFKLSATFIPSQIPAGLQ